MATAGAGAPADGGEGQQAAQEGAQAEEGQQAQQAVPQDVVARLDAFEQQFSGLPDQIAQLHEAFGLAGEGEEGQQQGIQQQAAPQVLVDPQTGQMYDFNTGEPINPGEGQQQGLSQEQVDQRIEERARAIAQEAVAPLQAEQHGQQLAALEEAYPLMRDGDVAQKVVAEARELAAEYGNPEAWRSPKLLENVFLAQRARERAAEEEQVASTGDDVELEGAGAVASGGQGDADVGDAIVAAGGGRNFWQGGA